MFDDTADISPILKFVAKGSYGGKFDLSPKEVSLKSIGSSTNLEIHIDEDKEAFAEALENGGSSSVMVQGIDSHIHKPQVKNYIQGNSGVLEGVSKVVESSSILPQNIFSYVCNPQAKDETKESLPSPQPSRDNVVTSKSPRRVKKAKFASLSSMLVLGDITNKSKDNILNNSTQDTEGLIHKAEKKIAVNSAKEVVQSRKSKRFRKVPARLKEDEQIVVEDLKLEEQEAIAMKMFGENDVHVMYSNLDSHLKQMKKKFKLNVNLATLESGEKMLCFLVDWALKSHKIELKNDNGTLLTQEYVTLL